MGGTIVVGYDATIGADAALAEGLLQVADEHDARFIAVGSYGETPLRGALVGSTPYRLVHLSSRPVLVVRAER